MSTILSRAGISPAYGEQVVGMGGSFCTGKWASPPVLLEPSLACVLKSHHERGIRLCPTSPGLTPALHMRSDSLRSQPLHEVVGPCRLGEARQAREYAATHGQREMKRVVPIGHAASYRLVDPVIGLRKAVDGCMPAQPGQPLLDDVPGANGVVIVVGIAVAWRHNEDQLKTVRTRSLDDLQHGVERRLIESRPIRFADVRAPDIGREAFERRLGVAPGRTIQIAARTDLENRPSAENVVSKRGGRIPEGVGAAEESDGIPYEFGPGCELLPRRSANAIRQEQLDDHRAQVGF